MKPFFGFKIPVFEAIVLFFALTLSVGLVRGERSIKQYWLLSQSRHVLAETVDNLRQENLELSDEIRKIKTSSAYARKVLRERYHVTEPGERIEFLED